MIELVQFPWSPFCLVQRRILEYSGTPFKIVNIPPQDRSLVWKLTRQRYYGVAGLIDGKTDIFEEMLMYNTFLLGERPRFVDFDLFGMLENFLYSGHYKLPARHKELRQWHARIAKVKIKSFK